LSFWKKLVYNFLSWLLWILDIITPDQKACLFWFQRSAKFLLLVSENWVLTRLFVPAPLRKFLSIFPLKHDSLEKTVCLVPEIILVTTKFQLDNKIEVYTKLFNYTRQLTAKNVSVVGSLLNLELKRRQFFIRLCYYWSCISS